jgi:hypothetical protein
MGTSYNPKIVTDGLVLNLDPANVKSYPANQDPFVNNVSLMLDGESLTDKSQNAVTVTVQGAVTVDSSVKKIGNSSLKFAGALTDYLTVPSSSLFAFPGDFTIEFWTYANQWGQRSGATVYFCNGVLNQFQLAVYPATQIELYLNGSSFINVPLSASIVGRWMHIALVRSGSTIRIYENGTSVGSGTSSYSVPASICYIGKQLPRSPTNYGHNLDGYIDDLKVTKGAKYTANFTPPTQPLSLPGRLTDLTKNKISSTLTNTTFTSSNGGLLTYNGNSSTTVGSSAITGVSEFTVMVWFNSSSIVNYKNVLDFNYNFNGAGSSNTGPRLEMSSAGNLLWVFSGSSTNSTTVNSYIEAKSSSLQTNTWYCAVVTRDNSLNVKAYLNGLDSGNSVIQAAGNNSAFIGSFNKITTGVGCYPYSDRYLSGYVSIILAYNRALTAAEVLQNYNATKGRFR